jgi:hypothetical protein
MHQSSSSMMDSEVTGRWCPSPFPAQWLSSLEWWQKWTRSRSLQLSCITLGEIYFCPVTVELPEFEMGSTLVHEILYPCTHSFQVEAHAEFGWTVVDVWPWLNEQMNKQFSPTSGRQICVASTSGLSWAPCIILYHLVSLSALLHFLNECK